MNDHSTPSLDRVLQSFVEGRPSPDWVSATSRIRGERRQVEALLARDEAPQIYGFNTLLAQLDDHDADTEAQQALYENHLVGPVSEASSGFLELVGSCKAEQLHHGGSGIDPVTYERLLSAEWSSAEGCWTGSYGAGDVAPAAWWVKALRESSLADRSWQQGDFIALINGNFMSTAWGLLAWAALIDRAVEFAARYAEVAVVSGARRDILRSEVGPLADLYLPSSEGSQLPVSQRDASAVLVPVVRGLRTLASALDARLRQRSGNPLFVEADGALSVESQSSFLGHELTFALTNGQQILHLMAGTMQRCITSVSARAGRGQDAKIQPPKVGTAYVKQLQSKHGVLPSDFAGAESDGVEDLWDLSLNTATSVIEVAQGLDSLFSIFDETVDDVIPEATVGRYRSELLAQVMPGLSVESRAAASAKAAQLWRRV